MPNLIYPCPNTRKCYWLCLDCLKGHNHCSSKCPDYLSRAKVKREVIEARDKKETHWDKLELERRLGK